MQNTIGIIYELNIRQISFDGTLLAAAAELERLHDLGIDTVWLMPIYPIGKANRKGHLGSYYSISDYCSVNPEMGTMADFDHLLETAHKLGMKVILDWVANHTSLDARWTREKPDNWYVRDDSGAIVSPCDWTDVGKLNYDLREVWQGQVDAMQFWVERGVDGFRCDMAMLVPTEFWRWAISSLREKKPSLFFLAEAEEEELFEAGFDVCYGWQFFHLCEAVARGHERADAINYNLRNMISNNHLQLLFTSNHDENSWSGSEMTRYGDSLELFTALNFILPFSVPLIYTGQEFGYDHSFSFFERDPMPRLSANDTTRLYRRLIELRHTLPAITRGRAEVINTNADDCLICLSIEYCNRLLIAILNASPYTVEADFDNRHTGQFTNAADGSKVVLTEHIHKFFEPWKYIILHN